MTFEYLKALIASGEGETLKVKETTGQRGDACETLCAFLNKDGGTVVFGVGKKGNVTGQLVSDKTKRELFEVFAEFEPARSSAIFRLDWNMPEPKILAVGGYTRTVFMRPVADSKDGIMASDSDPCREVNEVNHEVNQRILQILRNDPKCTIPVIAQLAQVSRATIDRAIKTLKEQGRIRRVGRTRGHWEVIEE